jgi:cell division protein FtsW
MDSTDEVRPYDRVLLGVILALTGLGVLMVYSASVVSADIRLQNAEHYLVRQSIHAAAGLAVLAIGLRLPIHLYQRHATKLLYGSLFLLALLLVPGIGITVNNSTRWMGLGPLRFQPSELAKMAFIIFLAYSLVKKGERMKQFKVGFAPHLLLLAVMVLLCMKQPDFGTSATMAGIMLCLLYIGGARVKYIAIAGILAIPVAYFAITASERRLSRIVAWLDPFAHKQDIGYHLVQSLTGIGSGGVFGLGLGESRQKLLFLPEAHTDFVVSVLGEEMGLFGIVLLVMAFGVICWRGMRVALEARDEFSSLLAFGITFSLTLQAFVNMSVVTGVLPTKGLTLPFVSYGGSSLIISMWMAGILLRISTRVVDEPQPDERARTTGLHKLRRRSRRPRMGPRPGPAPA